MTPSDLGESDLTSEARIRDAAIGHFARDGFRATTVRSIAATAGVSASLVIHHFGSKAALQAVCDDHVLRVITETARRKSTPVGIRSVMTDYFSAPEEYQIRMLYMARAIAADSPTASRFVDALVKESEGVFRRGIADGSMRAVTDVYGLAVLSVMNSLALFTTGPALAGALGLGGLESMQRRVALPYAELYTHGLYTDESVLDTVRAATCDGPEAGPRVPTRSEVDG